MILAVNIGNTNLRAAIGTATPDPDAVMPLTALNGSACFIDFIESRFGAGLWETLEGCIISSVVPAKTPCVIEAVTSKTGKPPKRIDESFGALTLDGYDGLPGEDRLACCAGALKKYGPPFILIDFGTATTVNVVDDKSRFLGGAILSGVSMGLKALSEYTAQLPNVEFCGAARLIGRSTGEALLSGAVIGAACAAGGYINRIEKEPGFSRVIVTGGHAPIVLPYCEFKCTHDPGILFEGLFSIYFSE